MTAANSGNWDDFTRRLDAKRSTATKDIKNQMNGLDKATASEVTGKANALVRNISDETSILDGDYGSE